MNDQLSILKSNKTIENPIISEQIYYQLNDRFCPFRQAISLNRQIRKINGWDGRSDNAEFQK